MIAPIVPVTVDRAPVLAAVMGRAFADDPAILWKLRAGVTADEVGETFEPLLAAHAQVGTLREIRGGRAVAGWLPPELGERFDELARSGRDAVMRYADDGGARFDAFWDWVGERLPADAWYLDFVGVDPAHQGRGYGSALVTDGLVRAHETGAAGFLLTETERNVSLYGRLGFRIVEEGDAPGGGPHIWFMRADPTGR